MKPVTELYKAADIAREAAQAVRIAANCKGLLHGEMHGFGRKA